MVGMLCTVLTETTPAFEELETWRGSLWLRMKGRQRLLGHTTRDDVLSWAITYAFSCRPSGLPVEPDARQKVRRTDNSSPYGGAFSKHLHARRIGLNGSWSSQKNLAAPFDQRAIFDLVTCLSSRNFTASVRHGMEEAFFCQVAGAYWRLFLGILSN